ncbi:hypothetical protein RJ640_018361 [Escallonia rubra]|uniref:Amino acid transporter transmembrane domain-containing protein n=1 Tax=Escallonia rubra TaxID=112253 RepID=A0AA88S1D9_9ASTE|nr:hypothetical protein RJ640_018361 [Escallonia rubra]
MWKLQKFKYSYFIATIYVFTLTLPSASAMYWAFGDQFLNHSNAFALLPKTRWRDTAVIHILIHQMIDYCSTVSSPALSLLILVPVNCAVFVFLTEIEWRNVVLVAQFITFGFACTPFYFVWEKGASKAASVDTDMVLGHYLPFFGPINSAIGALLVIFTVYIIPSLAHMLTYRKASARQHLIFVPDLQDAAEKPPPSQRSWTAMRVGNFFVSKQKPKAEDEKGMNKKRRCLILTPSVLPYLTQYPNPFIPISQSLPYNDGSQKCGGRRPILSALGC